DPTYEDTKNLNKRLKWQMESLDRGLTFVPLDLPTAKLFVFVDGSFANNRDMTSQLGFIIILGNEEPIDGHDDAFKLTGNVVHYSSTKSKRVTRSVLASEIYGMVAGVDMAYAILSTLAMITKKLNLPIIPTIACTDSYSLCECLVKLGTTQEKRQMIDIMALRQSYERRELYEVRWINGDDNLADALTKATPNQALENFITTSSAQIRMEGWVARA
ncbi:aurora kinase 2 splicing, partial [Colletotrichum tabaci]